MEVSSQGCSLALGHALKGCKGNVCAGSLLRAGVLKSSPLPTNTSTHGTKGQAAVNLSQWDRRHPQAWNLVPVERK